MSFKAYPVPVYTSPFHIDAIAAIVLTFLLFVIAVKVSPLVTVGIISFQQGRKCYNWYKLVRGSDEIYTKWTSARLAHPFNALLANLAWAQGAAHADMQQLTGVFTVAAALSFLQYMALIKVTLRRTQP